MNLYKGMAIRKAENFPGNPTIVFLHDSLGCIELWRDFPDMLVAATHCNMLIYDRLGYGKSDPLPTPNRPVNYMEKEADLLNDLLVENKIEQAILFGHSDGGTIALLAASMYPQRISAVITEAAHIFVEEITLKGIYAAKEAYEQTNLRERLQKYHSNKTETMFNAWVQTWTSPNYRNWNIENFLPGIHCPLLFIQGEADEYGTQQQVNSTISKVSGYAESYIIPNVGHTPHKQAPDITLALSQKFIVQVIINKNFSSKNWKNDF